MRYFVSGNWMFFVKGNWDIFLTNWEIFAVESLGVFVCSWLDINTSGVFLYKNSVLYLYVKLTEKERECILTT